MFEAGSVMKWVALILGVLLASGSVSHAATTTAPATAAPAVNLDQLRGAIVGTWQNTADPGFTRELRPDGTATERYEGDDSATATTTVLGT